MDVRSLSRTEARVALSMEADRVEEASLDEIQRRTRVSRSFARKIASGMVRKGWLQRTGRGRYLLNPSRHGPDAIPDTDPFRIGRRIASPYYFGYATAAELLGLLPQASRVYYLVSTTRGSSRVAHAAQFRRVYAPPTRFFGLRSILRRGERLSVSDLERTVLDCIDRPEYSGGVGGAVRVLESAGRRLNWSRIRRYLDRLGNRSLALRLGFLAELLGRGARPPARWAERARARPMEPYVPLGGPTEFGRRGPHDHRWHIVRNVPEPTLLAEVDIR
ncbi:MAG: type IV toxin-antitoxin system AbiEi family antitoxin domain-containing protein [Thermoplasmata archaeon]